MHFRMAGYTSAGMVRQKNEDCFAILPSHQGAFLADGMGGLAHGQFAAEIATTVGQTILGNDAIGPRDRLLSAFDAANNAIHYASRALRAPMGAVAVAVLICGRRLYFAHLGDARLYIYDPVRGILEQLTRDHVAGHGNEVTRYLGSFPVKDAPIADYGEVPFPPSAYFVMNSDGLTRVLSTTGLAEIVAIHADDPEAAAERLICNANARGADDNITVVIGMEGHDQKARSVSHALRRAIIAGLLSAGPLLAPVTAGIAK